MRFELEWIYTKDRWPEEKWGCYLVSLAKRINVYSVEGTAILTQTGWGWWNDLGQQGVYKFWTDSFEEDITSEVYAWCKMPGPAKEVFSEEFQRRLDLPIDMWGNIKE